ncbi:MAG: DEAD/DEAH box helicase [Bryobacteraceae bacterium]|nr:DEAD/DEAH box helicase [Bryobacteraceae bacterium]
MALSGFDPLIRQWFTERIGTPTEPQMRGWSEIQQDRNVLISAPTGSGKTLAAFLVCLDRLVRESRAGTLQDKTQVLYVSPLKALSNDVQKNLDRPLAEIQELASRQGVPLGEIRTALRTGDTPASERLRMGRKPPHILVTTPESLYILLTAERSRQWLKDVRTVIVDEIHAIADDKRGAHLSLSLARLDALTGSSPLRIGLSATVKPLEDVAGFLAPETRIVNVGHRREMDIGIEVPTDELGPILSNEMWAEIYDRLCAEILRHRTTLVFVNTRRLSERVSHALSERLGENMVLPHHGSLSKTLRLDAEQKLKNGELRAVVATASLELGIDIGSVDIVCQIGSPRSIAVALQRIGRAGHWVHALPKGRIFPTTRDELVECAALIHAIRSGELERIEIPQNALDILAQQIVAEAACQTWEEDALFAMVRTAYPYRGLERRDFDDIIVMLSEGIVTSRGRSGAYLHRDQVNHRVKGRRGARLTAITSGGAIPETGLYSVIAEPDGKTIGTVEEDFAIESMAGDVFLLGTHSWRIKRVEPGRVRVEDAGAQPPSIPFWFGEAPGRSIELSAFVSQVRRTVAASPASAPAFLQQQCGLDEAGARQAIAYITASAAHLGALPTGDTIVAERFFDEAGGMQLILHSPLGSRINRAWGLALRKRFCRTFNFELQAAATDNGIVISLSDQHSFPLELVFEFLRPATVEDVLKQALLVSPMFNARWRWNATRALAILRSRGGARVPAPIQRMKSDDLLAAVFPDQAACAENLTGPPRIPDHPLVKETINNCLYEAMDLHGLKHLVEGILDGRIRTHAVETAEASPFSHEILNANPYAFLDDAPLEERRARAVQLRRTLRTGFADDDGILDPAAIAQVSEEVWPEVRDADELHDALLTLVNLPPDENWREWFHQLRADGRVFEHRRGGAIFWTAVERTHAADDAIPIVRGWLESLGPVTAAELAARLAFPEQEIGAALLKLESEGQILQGHFSNAAGAARQWCNRRILARIHRATLGKLRREIEPVTSLEFHRFLCRWQHVAPHSQLHGPAGTLQIVRQLQGYELPASAWESEIFARRIANYDPAFLDELCLSGEVMWGRLSPHPAMETDSGRRVRPSRIAPISFFLRDNASWLVQPLNTDESSLSHAAHDILKVLRQYGASFFNELTTGAHRLSSEVEDALWELVAAGMVTADGFENLRALIDPKRRKGEGRGRHARPRHAAGRWALMRRTLASATADERAANFARQLLSRWGVLFRDLLARESNSPYWRDLLPVLRRMEAKGEIRGGRFVAGYSGEQFALPEAIDLLRAVRRAEPAEPVQVSSADPLNLSGIILPGPRMSTLLLQPPPLAAALSPAATSEPLARP